MKTPEMFDDEEAQHRRALIGTSPQVAFRVDDCRELYQSLLEKGVSFNAEPEEKPWGISAVARDPSGNQVVLTEETTSEAD